MIELTGYQDKHEYVNKHGVKSVVYLMDCMDAMAQMGEKEFSLACVDPPFGIDAAKMQRGNSRIKPDKTKNWDNNPPTSDYFDALFKVSDNQIIWGGNYFNIPPSQYFAIWDKGETMYGRDFAEAEFAWVRSGGTRIFKASPNQNDRIHVKNQSPFTTGYSTTTQSRTIPFLILIAGAGQVGSQPTNIICLTWQRSLMLIISMPIANALTDTHPN